MDLQVIANDAFAVLGTWRQVAPFCGGRQHAERRMDRLNSRSRAQT